MHVSGNLCGVPWDVSSFAKASSLTGLNDAGLASTSEATTAVLPIPTSSQSHPPRTVATGCASALAAGFQVTMGPP